MEDKKIQWKTSGYIAETVREYSQGCYQSLIGSGIRPFRLHKNHWPWMTLKGHNALWYANSQSCGIVVKR